MMEQAELTSMDSRRILDASLVLGLETQREMAGVVYLGSRSQTAMTLPALKA